MSSRCRLARLNSVLVVVVQAVDTVKRPEHQPIPPTRFELNGSFGKQVRLEPGITYSKTPGYWEVPGHPAVVPLGASEAKWLPAY
jgi:hypothetical protein